MPCLASLGRLEGCKDQVGGLTAVYFANFDEVTFNTPSDGEIDGIDETTPGVYKYDLRGTSTFDQTLTSDQNNGTTFAEQTLVVSLKSQDSSTHKEIKALAWGRPKILVEDNNGNIFVVGHEYGTQLSATTSTGAAMGDKTGYELTFTAMEKELAPFYTGVIGTDFNVTVGS